MFFAQVLTLEHIYLVKNPPIFHHQNKYSFNIRRFLYYCKRKETRIKNQFTMETKKYTTHPSFWMRLAANIIIWTYLILAFYLSGKTIKDSTDILLIVLISIFLVIFLVDLIQCGLAWQSYLEVSSKGVKMKGCAKRIPVNKNENINDIFIPWGDIEEIKGWIGYPVLILKTGDTIKLTKEIDINGRTLQKDFEKFKAIQRQKELELENEPKQLKDEIISVISEVDDKGKV